MTIAFWLLAAITVASALAVVLLRDIFRSALCLILSFVAVAGIYVTLNADLLAALQILVYVGAVAVLIIFALMLTREYRSGGMPGRTRAPAIVLSVALLATMVLAVVGTAWPRFAAAPDGSQAALDQSTAEPVAELLFEGGLAGGFLLPFEIAAALLLASIIGALVMARARE